jgi:hypothetical protein
MRAAPEQDGQINPGDIAAHLFGKDAQGGFIFGCLPEASFFEKYYIKLFMESLM